MLRLKNLPTNNVMQYPSGRWGFVGRVDITLSFARKDGEPLTDADKANIAEKVHFGERFVTGANSEYKSLTFATEEEAKEAKRVAESG